jgi:hypothetical protein
MVISPSCVTLEDRFTQSSKYTGLPMDRRVIGADMVACRTAGDVVPDGVAGVPCLTTWLAFGEGAEGPVVAFCEEVVVPVVADVPDAVVVFVVVSTAKPCCWISDTSR